MEEGEKIEYNHDNELPLSTGHLQISTLPSQHEPACINQPRSLDFQQQSICTTQPQASDLKPQQTAYGVKDPNTSWDDKLNTPHQAIVRKPAPVIRQTENEIPPTYLPLALISFFCCFWPVGAFAIIYSCKTSLLLDDGDLEGAHAASKKALILSLTSIGIMISFFIILILGLIISNNTR